MHKRIGGLWSGLATAVALAVWAGPAGAGEFFAWRTDDGGYAFADDEKSIPPRYRARAERRVSQSLSSYRQFTPSDAAASSHYAERLEARLAHLRQMNAVYAARQVEEPTAAAPVAGQPKDLVILRGGRRDRAGIDIGLPAGGGEEPLVVDIVASRRSGKAVTEHVQVTRRGDRIVSIARPRSREWNVNDVVDEEELLQSVEGK